MSEPRARRKRTFFSKLLDKYRLSLVNESSFEERLSIRLSRINVLLLATGAFLVCAALVTGFIVFTPVKRMIPGYSDQKTKRDAYRATLLADSLEGAMAVRDLYLTNLRSVLNGELPADSATLFRPIAVTPDPEDLKAGPADSATTRSLMAIASSRLWVMNKTAFFFAGTTAEREGLSGIFFFAPLRGVVTGTFDKAQRHFGIDIVTRPDEAVKPCLDGTVVLSDGLQFRIGLP